MRTTITLPDTTYRLIKTYAEENRESFSKTVNDMALRDIARRESEADPTAHLSTDPLTGFPILITNDDHVFTVEEVEELIAEDWYE